MRQIDLQWLRISNFKSFREEITFKPAHYKGLKFLGGDNIEEPRLGANGAGKSSLWDALIWCLYGTTARGNKLSDVLTWGAKSAKVTACLAMEGELVEITRTGPPARIYIGEDIVSQDDVDTVTGLSRVRFMHAVVFGQAVPLFIDLPIPQRGDLLEEILDLGLWTRLSDRANAYSTQLGREIANNAQEVARLEGRLSGLEDEDDLRRRERAWTVTVQRDLDAVLDDFEKLERSTTLANTDALRYKLNSAITQGRAEQLSLNEVIDDLATAKASKALAEKTHKIDLNQIFFYRDTKECPTCGQAMSPAHAYKHQLALEKAQDELLKEIETCDKRIQKDSVKAEKLRATLQTWDRNIETLRGDLRIMEHENAAKKHALDTLEKRADTLAKERDSNPHSARLRVVQQTRAQAQSALTQTRELTTSLQGRVNVADFWRAGFKRVRLFLIKQALQALEVEVNSAASVLGLPDWKITFATETETKTGTLKLGVQVIVSTPSTSAAWEVWSGGEAQRIRLAIAIGLANMIQRMSGVYWTTEVWDEPSAWLSPEGIEDLLECLKYRADVTNRSVWVLDHRALTYSGFSEHWEVTKAPKIGSTVACIGVVE